MKWVIKRIITILFILCVMCNLCSCTKSQIMTKDGEKVSVQVKGIDTKKLTVIVKGDFPDDCLKIEIPSSFDLQEDKEGNLITTEVPFMETISSSCKNKKVSCSFKALYEGSCTLGLSFSPDGVHKDISVKIDLSSDENLSINCSSILLDEQEKYTKLKIDENSFAYFEQKGGGTADFGILNNSNHIYIEGYDSSMIKIIPTDNYVLADNCSFEEELMPLKEGNFSLTLIDEAFNKRYIAGFTITKDTTNLDISENLIITFDDIIAEVLESEENYVEGDEQNEHDS